MVSFILDFLPLIALDLGGLWRGTSNATAANGQYLLLRAASYRAVGGHRTIAGALVDDFALASLMRAHGRRIAFVDGTTMLSCHMYHNANEVWAGFSKNILLALDTSNTAKRRAGWGLLFAWGYASLFVLPFAWLFSRYRTRFAAADRMAGDAARNRHVAVGAARDGNRLRRRWRPGV